MCWVHPKKKTSNTLSPKNRFALERSTLFKWCVVACQSACWPKSHTATGQKLKKSIWLGIFLHGLSVAPTPQVSRDRWKRLSTGWGSERWDTLSLWYRCSNRGRLDSGSLNWRWKPQTYTSSLFPFPLKGAESLSASLVQSLSIFSRPRDKRRPTTAAVAGVSGRWYSKSEKILIERQRVCKAGRQGTGGKKISWS